MPVNNFLNCHNISTIFTNLKVIQRSPALTDGAGIYSFDELSTSTVPEKLLQVLLQKDIMQLCPAISGAKGILVSSSTIIRTVVYYCPL
jgi:hypothetical protein